MTEKSRDETDLQAVATVLAIAVASLGRPAVASPTAAATLVEVTNFGANPTNLRMYLYVPDRLAARPPVVVAALGARACAGRPGLLVSSYSAMPAPERGTA